MKYLLLLAIGVIWGSQFALNSIVLNSFSPLGLASIRMLIGAITLSLVILFKPSERKNRIKFTPKLVRLLCAIGITDAAIPFFCICYGQMHLDSSIVSIVVGTTPMFTILMSVLTSKNRKVSVNEVVGMVIAFIGLIVLVNPSTDSLNGDVWGYLFIFGATISFSISFMLMKRIPQEVSTLKASRFILLVYAILGIFIWGMTNEMPVPTSSRPWVCMVILGIFASGLVYIFYLGLVRLAGATFTSLSNYIVPFMGTIMGVCFLDEEFTYNIAGALVLILIGLFVVNMQDITIRKRKKVVCEKV